MTNELTWRLSKLPTVEELQQLVKDKIITKEEAKDVLFKASEDETEEELVKAQSEEIKFLKTLVEKLAGDDNTKIIKIIEVVKKPYYLDPWFTPYGSWSTSGGNSVTYTDSGSYNFTGANSALLVGNATADVTMEASTSASYASSEPISFSSI